MADCGLLNLGSCLTQNFFEFIINILNSPTQPLLELALNLLSEPINLSPFFTLWVIVVYLLSIFYALLLLGTGFNFIISGYDSAKRENAKSWLRNIIIMIILVQASYFIYQLAIDLSSALSSATLSLIDENFFLISADGIVDIGVSFVFTFLYLISILWTVLILIVRYAIVSIGVVLFPIAIFFYFISPLKQYGSLILNILGSCIFVTFFDAVVLIGFSKIANMGIFSNMKILVLITAFLVVNFIMISLMLFSIVKAALNVYSDVRKIGGLF